MKKKLCLWKILFIAAGIAALSVIINFIPIWDLKTADMLKMEGKWVDVYYETEEAQQKMYLR